MEQPLSLTDTIKFIRANPYVHPRGSEGAFKRKSFYRMKIVISKTRGLNNGGTLIDKFSVGIVPEEKYSEYFDRVVQVPEIKLFFDSINEKNHITAAKYLINVIEGILNNPELDEEVIAESVKKTYLNNKLSGSYIIWLRGISVEDKINMGNDWILRSINEQDYIYEDDDISSRVDLSMTRAIFSSEAILEIPYEKNVDAFSNNTILTKKLINKIINFLRLYKIAGVQKTRFFNRLDSLVYFDKRQIFYHTTSPFSEDSIKKSEENQINELWMELKDILPSTKPPYDLLKGDKQKLQQEINQNKGTLQAQQIQDKIDTAESPFRPAWISQAIYSRHYFKCVSDEERIHHITSAIETVLVKDKNDTVYKFRTRGANILNLIGPQSGLDVFDILNKIYGVRSNYAHGSRNRDLKAIQMAYSYGPTYARNLILLYYLYIKDKCNDQERLFEYEFPTLVEYSLFDNEKRTILSNFINKYSHFLLPAVTQDQEFSVT